MQGVGGTHHLIAEKAPADEFPTAKFAHWNAVALAGKHKGEGLSLVGPQNGVDGPTVALR